MIGLGVVTLFSVLGFLAVFARNVVLRDQLAEAYAQVRNGTMAPPSSELGQRVAPDRAPGAGRAQLELNHEAPAIVDLRIAMAYAHANRFRMTVDKRDQGRALVIDNIARDSNGDLRISFNSSALAGGEYDVRIDELPVAGTPVAVGWFVLRVH